MAELPAVLIVGGGMLQVPLLREAFALGLQVLLTDKDWQCPGRQIADAFWPVDTSDIEGHRHLGETLRKSPWWKLRGVVTAGNDCAPAVSAAAEAAGVQGIPLTIAQLTHDKARVRELLVDAGLSHYQPAWCTSELISKEPRNAALRTEGFAQATVEVYALMYDLHLPLIIKPLEERASRGISIIRDASEWHDGEEKALRYGSKYLIEELLTGTEHSAEVIFGNDGEVLWWNIVDRYFDYNSGVPIETGHVNPTCLGEHAQQQIILMTLAAARALGVTWGPFKVDVMRTTDGPKILECTARLSGGFDCQWTCPATNRHPMRLLLQLACGLPHTAEPPIDAAEGFAAAIAVLQPRSGILRRLRLPPWVHGGEALPWGMEDRAVVMTVQEGDAVPPLEHNAQRCGYVMAHGVRYAGAWETASGVAAAIAQSMEIEDV